MSALHPHFSLTGVVSLLFAVYMVQYLIKAWRVGAIDDGEVPARRYVLSQRPFMFWALFALNLGTIAGLAALGVWCLFGSDR